MARTAPETCWTHQAHAGSAAHAGPSVDAARLASAPRSPRARHAGCARASPRVPPCACWFNMSASKKEKREQNAHDLSRNEMGIFVRRGASPSGARSIASLREDSAASWSPLLELASATTRLSDMGRTHGCSCVLSTARVLYGTQRTHAGLLQLASARSALMSSCSIYGCATRVGEVWPGQRLGAAGRRGHGKRRVGLPGAERAQRSCRLLPTDCEVCNAQGFSSTLADLPVPYRRVSLASTSMCPSSESHMWLGGEHCTAPFCTAARTGVRIAGPPPPSPWT
jgi:hypothetical protein